MNPQTASYILTDWKPLYQGIEYASGVASYPLGVPLPNPPKSRIQHVNVLRITLSAPGISFFTNPKQGSLHTVRRTITQFLTDYPDVRVAINANFACHDSKSDCSMDCFLFGLAISKGDIVCDPTKPVAEPKNAPPVYPRLHMAGRLWRMCPTSRMWEQQPC